MSETNSSGGKPSDMVVNERTSENNTETSFLVPQALASLGLGVLYLQH